MTAAVAMPQVLDLFCCAGGATKGYQRAGFRVVGVDVVDRPNYCGDEFIRADALDFLDHSAAMRPWVLVHASCPCQAGCTMTLGTNRSKGWGGEHTQFVPATRERLDRLGVAYVLEQPAGHKGLIRTDVRLCMDMFPVGDPPWVQRHRDFELGGPWPVIGPAPKHVKHRGYVRGLRHGIWREGPYVAAYGAGGGKASVAEMQHALGIDWTDVREELTEAIPPAYTQWLGTAMLARGAQ